MIALATIGLFLIAAVIVAVALAIIRRMLDGE